MDLINAVGQALAQAGDMAWEGFYWVRGTFACRTYGYAGLRPLRASAVAGISCRSYGVFVCSPPRAGSGSRLAACAIREMHKLTPTQ
jgi:hypothetical protein